MATRLIFRQLFDKSSSTYTYLLGCSLTRKALLIDAVLDQTQRDIQLISQLDLDLQYTLNTHMHADHVRSCQSLKEHFPELQSVHGDEGGKCDILVHHHDLLKCGDSISLECLATPGHTDGCVSYYLNDSVTPMVFTGDALLIRGCGRTDFQGGSASVLYDSITEVLYKLPDETMVYPGHNYQGIMQSSIGEEKQFNSRCPQGQTREQFIEIMDNLNLKPPAHLGENLASNKISG